MTAHSPEQGTYTPVSDPLAALQYLRQRSLRYQRQAVRIWLDAMGCEPGWTVTLDELHPCERAAFVAWWQTHLAPATFRIHR